MVRGKIRTDRDGQPGRRPTEEMGGNSRGEISRGPENLKIIVQTALVLFRGSGGEKKSERFQPPHKHLQSLQHKKPVRQCTGKGFLVHTAAAKDKITQLLAGPPDQFPVAPFFQYPN